MALKIAPLLPIFITSDEAKDSILLKVEWDGENDGYIFRNLPIYRKDGKDKGKHTKRVDSVLVKEYEKFSVTVKEKEGNDEKAVEKEMWKIVVKEKVAADMNANKHWKIEEL